MDKKDCLCVDKKRQQEQKAYDALSPVWRRRMVNIWNLRRILEMVHLYDLHHPERDVCQKRPMEDISLPLFYQATQKTYDSLPPFYQQKIDNVRKMNLKEKELIEPLVMFICQKSFEVANSLKTPQAAYRAMDHYPYPRNQSPYFENPLDLVRFWFLNDENILHADMAMRTFCGMACHYFIEREKTSVFVKASDTPAKVAEAKKKDENQNKR